MGQTLKKFPTLFGGGLGMLNIKPVKLALIDGAKPYHARLFLMSFICDSVINHDITKVMGQY
jgi:hypothetical protein